MCHKVCKIIYITNRVSNTFCNFILKSLFYWIAIFFVIYIPNTTVIYIPNAILYIHVIPIIYIVNNYMHIGIITLIIYKVAYWNNKIYNYKIIKGCNNCGFITYFKIFLE